MIVFLRLLSQLKLIVHARIPQILLKLLKRLSVKNAESYISFCINKLINRFTDFFLLFTKNKINSSSFYKYIFIFNLNLSYYSYSFTSPAQTGVVFFTDEFVVIPQVHPVPCFHGTVTQRALEAGFVVQATKHPSHDV